MSRVVVHVDVPMLTRGDCHPSVRRRARRRLQQNVYFLERRRRDATPRAAPRSLALVPAMNMVLT